VVALTAACAQSFTLDIGQGGGTAERALQIVALLTLIATAPAALVMVTSFTRIVVVLSLLRSALGTPTSPPNAVLLGLALFLTAFIMMPTIREVQRVAVDPLLERQIEPQEAFRRGLEPLRQFMLRHTREKDLALFIDLSGATQPEGPETVEMTTLIPAFMISELRRAFEIGFLLFLPFLVIDLVVASILTSVGMMMVPPAVVALPFKLIFFVLVDGWALLAGSLVKSYAS
jgi:flagellar biosynthetic protein FliP